MKWLIKKSFFVLSSFIRIFADEIQEDVPYCKVGENT